MSVRALDRPRRRDRTLTAIQYYETAAWSTTHCIKPGRYPVYLRRWDSQLNITITYDTTVLATEFTTLLAGVPINRGASGEGAGTNSQHHVTLYDYQTPAALTDGAATAIWLGGTYTQAEGVTFEECWSLERDGTPSIRYGTRPIVSPTTLTDACGRATSCRWIATGDTVADLGT